MIIQSKVTTTINITQCMMTIEFFT